MSPLKILIAGLGNMGRSHAIACATHPGFEVVGLVNRSPVADLPPANPAATVAETAAFRMDRRSIFDGFFLRFSELC